MSLESVETPLPAQQQQQVPVRDCANVNSQQQQSANDLEEGECCQEEEDDNGNGNDDNMATCSNITEAEAEFIPLPPPPPDVPPPNVQKSPDVPKPPNVPLSSPPAKKQQLVPRSLNCVVTSGFFGTPRCARVLPLMSLVPPPPKIVEPSGSTPDRQNGKWGGQKQPNARPNWQNGGQISLGQNMTEPSGSAPSRQNGGWEPNGPRNRHNDGQVSLGQNMTEPSGSAPGRQNGGWEPNGRPKWQKDGQTGLGQNMAEPSGSAPGRQNGGWNGQEQSNGRPKWHTGAERPQRHPPNSLHSSPSSGYYSQHGGQPNCSTPGSSTNSSPQLQKLQQCSSASSSQNQDFKQCNSSNNSSNKSTERHDFKQYSSNNSTERLQFHRRRAPFDSGSAGRFGSGGSAGRFSGSDDRFSGPRRSWGFQRQSILVPKFEPERYEHGWLFSNINKEEEEEGMEDKKEGEEAEADSSLGDDNNKMRAMNCLNSNAPKRAAVLFMFNLTPIVPFFTSKYVFSNHYMCERLSIDGKAFLCTEQYYMYNRALVFGDRQAMDEVMATREPGQMKRIGSRVVGYDKWKWYKVAIQVMVIASVKKFEQNPWLRRQLFETAGAELVEASPMDDRWGIGLGMEDWRVRDKQLWRGKNWMGRLLVAVRERLLERPEFAHEREEMLHEIRESMEAASSVGCLQLQQKQQQVERAEHDGGHVERAEQLEHDDYDGRPAVEPVEQAEHVEHDDYDARPAVA